MISVSLALMSLAKFRSTFLFPFSRRLDKLQNPRYVFVWMGIVCGTKCGLFCAFLIGVSFSSLSRFFDGSERRIWSCFVNGVLNVLSLRFQVKLLCLDRRFFELIFAKKRSSVFYRDPLKLICLNCLPKLLKGLTVFISKTQITGIRKCITC